MQKSAKKLTDVSVQKLPPGMHWDSSTPAFGVRVGKKSRTFVCVKSGGFRVTIGRYPGISLQDARREAKFHLLGIREKTVSAGFTDAVERYLRHMEGELRPRSHYEYRLILKRFHFATLSVTPGEISDALNDIERLSARAHAYTVLKIFFNWAVRHEYIERSPMERLRKPKVPSGRERILADNELVAIWNAAGELGKYGALVRLLMTTGQRKGQLAALKEDWVDWKGKRFIFPADAMKTKRVHVLPFSQLTDFILRGVTPSGGYYFSPESALGQPFTAWSKNKAILDKLTNIDHWTLHNLRHTWSTNAARLEVAPYITERVLSHVAPEGRVAGIYNKWRYEQEMRDAAEKMGTFLTGLLAK